MSDGSAPDGAPPTTYSALSTPPSAPSAEAVEPTTANPGVVADVTTPVATAPYNGAAVPPPPKKPSPLTPQWFARRRARARKVRRTIRHIDPWSVLKVSILIYICLYIAILLAGVLLWSAAVGSGLIDNIESFIEELLAFETFELQPDEIFRGFAIIGLVLAAAGVAFNVVMAIVFNLISDLTGGVRITVLEEDEALPYYPVAAPVQAPAQVQGGTTASTAGGRAPAGCRCAPASSGDPSRGPDAGAGPRSRQRDASPRAGRDGRPPPGRGRGTAAPGPTAVERADGGLGLVAGAEGLRASDREPEPRFLTSRRPRHLSARGDVVPATSPCDAGSTSLPSLPRATLLTSPGPVRMPGAIAQLVRAHP